MKFAACLCFTTLLLLGTAARAQIRLSERYVLQRLPYEPYSLSLEGGQYIEVPASESLNVKGPFTIEAWLKPDTQSDQVIVERFNPNSSKNSEGGYGLRLVHVKPRSSTSGRLYFFINEKQSKVEEVQGTLEVVNNKWHHIAGVFDGAQMCVFLDGRKDTCKPVQIKPGKSKASLRIGGRTNNANNGDQTFDLIHKARVSAGALYRSNFEREEILMGAIDARGYWRFDLPPVDLQRATDSSGNRNHGAIRGANEQTFRNEFPPVTYKLKPGDVLVLRRWTPNFEALTSGSFHVRGPDSVVDRIPLRNIKEPARNEPTEKLYPYERQLLADILTVNRTQSFNAATTGQTDTLLRVLQTNEVRLWNTLIENLRITAIPEGRRKVNSSYLMLTVLTQKLTDMLTASGAPANLFRSGPVEFELAAIDPHSSAWKAILGSTPGRNSDFYGTTDPLAMFNFLTVELNGVVLKRPQAPENQWSLRDLDESQICSSLTSEKLQIVKITLAGNRETYRILRETDKTPSHVVDTVVRDGRAVRVVTRVYNTDGYDHRYLYYSDLQKLYLEDISKIQWGLSGGDDSSQQSQPALTLPHNCQLR